MMGGALEQPYGIVAADLLTVSLGNRRVVNPIASLGWILEGPVDREHHAVGPKFLDCLSKR